MPATTKFNLTIAALLSLFFCALLLPGRAEANEKSVFSNDPCPGAADCVCPAYLFCVRPEHLNNPSWVHFRIYSYEDYFNVREGSGRQIEAKYGELVYVHRSENGPTSFGVQLCKKTLTGSDCDAWVNFTLQEPTVGQLEQCQHYADEAVAAVAAKTKLGCNDLTGPRWSSDPKAHYNACAGNPAADWASETAARTQDLKTCKDKTAAASAPPPQPKGYAGTWAISTDQGGAFTFVITQAATSFNGQMLSSNPQFNGTLQGTLEPDGNAVKFSFVQPGINASGSGRFWLQGDSDSMEARFIMDNSNGAVHLFTGKRK